MQSLPDIPAFQSWPATTATARVGSSRAGRAWSLSPVDEYPQGLVLAVRIEHRDSAEVSLLRSQVEFAYELLAVLTQSSELHHVVSLARRGLIDEARAGLRRLQQERQGDEKPTKPEIPASGKAFLKNLKFLEDHREALLGQWVALEDGMLLDKDSTLRSLNERLGQANRLRRGVLVTKVY